MTQLKNPFAHHHDHGHDHGHSHDHADEVKLDPGQQALSDALRVCFGLLKLVMLVLLVVYLFSGVFWVEQQERKVRLFLGMIVGEEGRQVLDPGGPYFAAPWPIMHVIDVPVAPRTLSIDKAFWYEQTQGAQTPDQAKPLNPEKDGSLITGDANIIHVKWTLTYSVSDPIAYVTNVGDAARADALVRATAEEAIVEAVAQATADAASKGNVNADVAKAITQKALDGLNTGLSIGTFLAGNPVFPVSVQSAFDAVTSADTRRGQAVTEAWRQREQMLQETAGSAYEALWDLVHDYELALQGDNVAKQQELSARLDAVLDAGEIDGQKIGGHVATLLAEAHAYRSNVVQEITAQVNRFNQLREQWAKNRAVLEAAYLAEARREILSNALETFWAPRGQVYLELNRDPAIERRRETERLKAEEEQRRRERAQQP